MKKIDILKEIVSLNILMRSFYNPERNAVLLPHIEKLRNYLHDKEESK